MAKKEGKGKEKIEYPKLDNKDTQTWMGLKVKTSEVQNEVNKSVFEISKFLRKMARKKFFRHRGEYGITDNGVLVPPHVMNKIRAHQEGKGDMDDDEFDEYLEGAEKKYSKFELNEEEMKQYWELVQKNEDAGDSLTETMLDRSDLLNDFIKKYKYTGDFPVDIDRDGYIKPGTPRPMVGGR